MAGTKTSVLSAEVTRIEPNDTDPEGLPAKFTHSYRIPEILHKAVARSRFERMWNHRGELQPRVTGGRWSLEMAELEIQGVKGAAVRSRQGMQLLLGNPAEARFSPGQYGAAFKLRADVYPKRETLVRGLTAGPAGLIYRRREPS